LKVHLKELKVRSKKYSIKLKRSKEQKGRNMLESSIGFNIA